MQHDDKASPQRIPLSSDAVALQRAMLRAAETGAPLSVTEAAAALRLPLARVMAALQEIGRAALAAQGVPDGQAVIIGPPGSVAVEIALDDMVRSMALFDAAVERDPTHKGDLCELAQDPAHTVQVRLSAAAAAGAYLGAQRATIERLMARANEMQFRPTGSGRINFMDVPAAAPNLMLVLTNLDVPAHSKLAVIQLQIGA